MSTEEMALSSEMRLARWLAEGDELLARGAASSALAAHAPTSSLIEQWSLLRQLRATLAKPEQSHAPSTLLPARLGRFVIERELGRGGFGIVYLALDPQTKRQVALKVPRLDVLSSHDGQRRFRLEAEAAARLHHPHVVAVFEAGTVGELSYLASAYCPGINLAEWLQAQTAPVPILDAAELVIKLSRAVQHAHERGVLHRDLKPANILLTTTQQNVDPVSVRNDPLGDLLPQITDFGLAKVLDDCEHQSSTGVVAGTASYMAPEQASGKSRALTTACDVYSLGAILYELLAGRPPFRGANPVATLDEVCHRMPAPLRRVRPGTPVDLETICLKCLEKDPEKRYRSAAELAEDLKCFVHGHPIKARPASRVQRYVYWLRRNPMAAGLSAVLATVLLGAAFIVTALWLRADRDRCRLEKVLAKSGQGFGHLVDLLLSDPAMQKNPAAWSMILSQAHDFQQGLAELASDSPALLLSRSRTAQNLAKIMHQLQMSSASTLAQQGLDWATELTRCQPDDFDARLNFAAAKCTLALLTAQDPDALRQAFTILQSLTPQTETQKRATSEMLGQVCFNVALGELGHLRLESCLRWARQSLAAQATLCAMEVDSDLRRRSFVYSAQLVIETLIYLGRLDEAEEVLASALSCTEKSLAVATRDMDWIAKRCKIRAKQAACRWQRGDLDGAARAFAAAEDELVKCLVLVPKVDDAFQYVQHRWMLQWHWALAKYERGRFCLTQTERAAEAETAFRGCRELLIQLQPFFPNRVLLYCLAISERNLAELRARTGNTASDTAEVLALRESTARRVLDYMAIFPSGAPWGEWESDLAQCCYEYALHLRQRGRLPEAFRLACAALGGQVRVLLGRGHSEAGARASASLRLVLAIVGDVLQTRPGK